MNKNLHDLKTILHEVNDLQKVASVLYWDQSTYMPVGGAMGRGQQLSTLSKVAHEKFTNAATGKLLDNLQSYADSLPVDSDDARLIRVTRRDYDKATKIPTQLLADFSAHTAATYQAWTVARPANDFETMRPYLEKTLDFSRQMANCFPGYDHIADPLIDSSDEGMKTAVIRQIFADLRTELIPLVKSITEQPAPDDSFLFHHYPEQKQLDYGMDIAKQYGFDTNRGRQDKTHHPFMTSFGHGDIRITTRVNENNFNDALFSTLHEAGHAMYEQGIRPELNRTSLADGTSSGVHESQSRLWENIVGRSYGFWQHYYPQLQTIFPESLNDVSMDSFYRAINKVSKSLIRTDSDEVTYNLHVMIRFDLSIQLLEGTLEVKDLPEAWNGRYQSDLGLHAPSDVDGVLQDVHWYSGMIGGQFQGYTLGNIMSSLFYEQALQAHPAIPSEIARGEFGTLLGWLQENIYQHGRKFTADELIKRTTGGVLTIAPYMAYLRDKFGKMYNL